MQGLHIIADLYNCPKSNYLTSANALQQLCLKACETAGLSILGEHFYQFDSFDDVQVGGATGAIVLAESHLAIHTWPERDGATLDVYVCNVTGDNSARAESLYDSLISALKPGDVMVKRVWRGKELPITVAA
ncbi:MAG: adenosylmethionine decarboxylase [Aeromicrobium sp.]|nr:adenosylmethionine decarboxylase [Burkholderiales bacterium]